MDIENSICSFMLPIDDLTKDIFMKRQIAFDNDISIKLSEHDENTKREINNLILLNYKLGKKNEETRMDNFDGGNTAL